MWTMVRAQVFLLVLLIQISTGEPASEENNTEEDYTTGNEVPGTEEATGTEDPTVNAEPASEEKDSTEEDYTTGNEVPGTEEPTGTEDATADNSEESPANHTVDQFEPLAEAFNDMYAGIKSGTIRLINGESGEICFGRVDIFFNDQWGTVCDDSWDMKDAQVVCRQMGCGRALEAQMGAYLGKSSEMPIWLNDVSCTGDEPELALCIHGLTGHVGSRNCGRGEVAGVVCAKKVTEVICGHSQIEISLTSQSQSYGLNVSSGHLADQSCSSFTVRDHRVWYHVQPRADICGNMFKTNGTHATYSNSLFVYPENSVSTTPMSFPFSCIYPLYAEISLNLIRPLLQMETGWRDNSVSSVASQPNTYMALFQNANYTEPYPAGPLTLTVGSALHVQVSVEEMDERFVVVLDDCYASHREDSNNRYYYIRNMCPKGHLVTVDENGTSLKARFSTLLFVFGRSHSDIFLHCSHHMCDQTTSSCSPTCSRRAKRFAPRTAGLPLKLMTIGPITLK